MIRDDRIDVLRAIGLLCIVLAHVDPPSFILQLRNFDVPLMVLISGSTFYITANNRRQNTYLSYLIDRIFRLVVPTWIFLLFFFGGDTNPITCVASFIPIFCDPDSRKFHADVRDWLCMDYSCFPVSCPYCPTNYLF